MKKQKVSIEAKSINQLREEHPNLIYNGWFVDEDFAKEIPEPGEYEIYFQYKNSTNKTYEEQKKLCPKGFEVTSAPILIQAMINHYLKTGERVLVYTYSRSSSRSSFGRLVSTGFFDSDGWRVDFDRPDSSSSGLGVSFSRKLGSRSLEPAPSQFSEAEVIKLKKLASLMKMTKQESSWAERFDELIGRYNDLAPFPKLRSDVKAFITKEIQYAEQRSYDQGYEEGKHDGGLEVDLRCIDDVKRARAEGAREALEKAKNKLKSSMRTQGSQFDFDLVLPGGDIDGIIDTLIKEYRGEK